MRNSCAPKLVHRQTEWAPKFCSPSFRELTISRRLHNSTIVAVETILFLFILFYLYIYPPDSQESNGGANT